MEKYEKNVLATEETNSLFWIGWMIANALLCIAHAIKESANKGVE